MNERILVAEDDPAILTGVADLLESEGYSVERAENGTAALERFRASPHDLVLLDVMMPGMNGYDLCRAIREENRNVPVVMLTAKGQEVDKVVGLELGADDYIVKPFGMAELLARVRSALRRGALTAVPTSEEDSVFSFGGWISPPCRDCGEMSPLNSRPGRRNFFAIFSTGRTESSRGMFCSKNSGAWNVRSPHVQWTSTWPGCGRR